MPVLTYRCPRCETTLQVHDDVVGEQLRCPNETCAQPLELEAAPATLVDAEADGAPAQVLDRTDLNTEREFQRLHPAMLRQRPVAALLLGLAWMANVVSLVWLLWMGSVWLALLPAVIAIGISIVFIVWKLIELYTTLIITSERVILEHGLLSRSTTEVRHNDVRNLQVDQGIRDRILGIGDIAASSSGQDDLEIVAKHFPRPHDLAEQIRALQQP